MTTRRFSVLIFLALGLLGLSAVLGLAGFALVTIGGQASDALGTVLALGGVLALGFVAATAVAWAVVEQRLVRPLSRLTSRLLTVSRAGAEAGVDIAEAHTLGPLHEAIKEVSRELRTARSEVVKAMAGASARSEEQRGWLEAILRDLSEAVVVCNLDHRILLYNKAAQLALAAPETTGLGRPILELVGEEAICHALSRLRRRAAEDASANRAESAELLCLGKATRSLLHGRMTLIFDAEGAPRGYVVVFSEAGRERARFAKRDLSAAPRHRGLPRSARQPSGRGRDDDRAPEPGPRAPAGLRPRRRRGEPAAQRPAGDAGRSLRSAQVRSAARQRSWPGTSSTPCRRRSTPKAAPAWRSAAARPGCAATASASSWC